MKTLFLILTFFSCSIFSQGTWVQTASLPQGAGVTDMIATSAGTLIVTTASYNWPSVPGGIRRSTNDGITWSNPLNVYNGRTLCIGYNGFIYASAWNYPSNEGLYRSTNDGASWGQIYPLAASNDNIFSIAVKENNNPIFIGTRNGVRRSVDGGISFPLVNNGIPANTWIRDLAVSPTGNYIAAGTTKGLYISSNNGDSWQISSGTSGDTIVWVMFTDASAGDNSGAVRLIAGSNNGELLKATEEELFLIAITMALFLPSEIVGGFTTGLDYLIMKYPRAPNSGGVERSTNGGLNFTPFNEGLPSNPKPTNVVKKGTKYILSTYEDGPNGSGTYVRVQPTGIQQISTEMPNGFSLSQNYPNPFNPTTNIKFQIPKSSLVRLVVCDILGREVETLVDKQLSAGTYQADWNAAKYSSGVYFYKLITRDFIETKKMILTE